MDDAIVVAQLRALEPIFHRSPARSGREIFERITDDNYWEVGASGAVYDRQTVLDVVAERYAVGAAEPPMAVDDFCVTRLDQAIWLVTYLLTQGERLTRRATIWRHDSDHWVAIYHQGTIITG